MHDAIVVSVSATHLRAKLRGQERCGRRVTPAELNAFAAWIERYAKATAPGGRSNEAAKWYDLKEIGCELWRWLDGTEGWLAAIRHELPNEMWFEFGLSQGGDQRFLDLPWELLADDDGFLAEREVLSFSVVRRMVPAQPPAAPSNFRPSIIFMAADPRENLVPLDYDGEEQAILAAVGPTGVDFLCEDSGNLEWLARLIRQETEGEAGVDIVHVSCHGALVDRPSLLLETELGEREVVGAAELDEAFGEFRPRLLFLSACTTAEPDRVLGSLAADLAARRFPAVIGWAGKVSDVGATRFASVFYHAWPRVIRLNPPSPEAAGCSTRSERRGEVRLVQGARFPWGSGWRANDQRRSPSPLERSRSGGPGIPRQGQQERAGRVAARVRGPPAPIQDVLRSLRQHRPTVIHGLGQHGKSSLANRIASRHASHDLVVVFGNYTATGSCLRFARQPHARGTLELQRLGVFSTRPARGTWRRTRFLLCSASC